MGSTIYNKAFAVELSHDFYDTGNEFEVNRDVEIFPTGECEKLFAKGRMRFVRNQRGIIVFYQAYKDGTGTVLPFTQLENDVEFVFALRMNVSSVSQMMNVTDFTVSGKTFVPGKLFELDATASNSDPDAVIDLTSVVIDQLRPEVFTYEFKSSDNTYTAPAKVTVKRGTDDIFVFPGVVRNPDTNTYSVELDFTNVDIGSYSIVAEKTVGSGTINSATLYVDGELVRAGAFSIIRFSYPDASYLYKTCIDKINFQTFQYAFESRLAQWRYFIVPRNITTAGFEFAVIDDGTNHYVFHASYPNNTQEYGTPDSRVAINGLSPIIMTSVNPIPFKESVLRSVSLYKKPTGGSGTALIVGLPNANITGVDSDSLGPHLVIPVTDPDIAEIFVIT